MGEFVWLSDDEGLECEPRIKPDTVSAILHPNPVLFGPDRRCDPRSRLPCRRELQPLNLDPGSVHVVKDLIAEILGHVVADKVGRHPERCDPVRYRVQFQRLDPVREVVRPDRETQFL